MDQDIADQIDRMYAFAVELSELPLVGSGKELSDLNIRWADQARENLHYFLVIHSVDLDEHWFAMIQNTISAEAWDDHHA